jgi:hypothetical protein
LITLVVVSESPSTCPSTWIITSRDINSRNKSPTSSIIALRFSTSTPTRYKSLLD